MSRAVSIFVGSTSQIDDLSTDLAAILGMDLQPRVDKVCSFLLRGVDGHLECFICENAHSLEDFTSHRYEYELDIQARYGDPVKRDEMQVTLARQLFDNLKETKRYSLLLVSGFAVKLDEFVPI